MDKAIDLALVGASGVVGNKIISLLEKKNINIDKYKSLIQTLESEGIQFYDSKEEMLNFEFRLIFF